MLGTLMLSIKMDLMHLKPRNYLFLCFGKVYTVKRVTWVAAIALFQDFHDQHAIALYAENVNNEAPMEN